MRAAITQKLSLSATGILSITDDAIGIEHPDTGEFIDLRDLLSDFADRTIRLGVTYDYDYISTSSNDETENENE